MVNARACKLALVQMRIEGGDKRRNVQHAVELIAEAAANGATMALLPECMDLGWTHPSALTDAEPIPDGQPCQALMQAAVEHQVHICSGLTEQDGDSTYNAAVYIDHRGRLLCRHRKLNELNIGHEYYAQGDRLNVVHTEFGTIGVMICADGFVGDHIFARSLCQMGADIILSPSAWAVPPDHDNEKAPYGDTWRDAYMPEAKTFATTIVGVSGVGEMTGGPWQGHYCIGCSLAISHTGEEVFQGPYGADAECILYLDIDPVPRNVRGSGWVEAAD